MDDMKWKVECTAVRSKGNFALFASLEEKRGEGLEKNEGVSGRNRGRH